MPKPLPMKNLFLLLLLLPILATAQSGDMRVYTVAGWYPQGTVTTDGTPATNAKISATEGVWMDNKCNIYFTDNTSKIRKVDMTSGLIYTVAGIDTRGYSGDGGPATNAKIAAYGLFVDKFDDLYIVDGGNRVRKIKASTGIITTVAGGGTVLGDGGPATVATLNAPDNVYGDNAGNLYIGEKTRIRKVNAAGIITTIAGTGIGGLSGDGGPATNAQVWAPTTMLLDGKGNLLFADRGNSRIRKINLTTGLISTIAGSSIGYSGDGGLATNAQLSAPLSFAIDKYDNLIIGDNQNDCIRKVDATTGIITTIAGVGRHAIGDNGEGVPATAAEMHPEFLYLDVFGNLLYSNFGKQIRKITNFNPANPYGINDCRSTEIGTIQLKPFDNPIVYPNPASDKLVIKADNATYGSLKMISVLGQQIMEQEISSSNETQISLNDVPEGFYMVILTGKDRNYYYKITVTKH